MKLIGGMDITLRTVFPSEAKHFQTSGRQTLRRQNSHEWLQPPRAQGFSPTAETPDHAGGGSGKPEALPACQTQGRWVWHACSRVFPENMDLSWWFSLTVFPCPLATGKKPWRWTSATQEQTG